MNREEFLQRVRNRIEPWDLAVVGGGATGTGIAVDAAARGYRVVLLEQSDFGKGTSSRSTKLVHGGVRYLQPGNVSLVMEALEERGLRRQNAPQLVHDLPFVAPNYRWWEAPLYGAGPKVYDLLAGRYGFGHSRLLSCEEVLGRIPTLEREGLRGGVLYHDGQFDDSRLLVNLVQTAAEHGACWPNPTHGAPHAVRNSGVSPPLEAHRCKRLCDLLSRPPRAPTLAAPHPRWRFVVFVSFCSPSFTRSRRAAQLVSLVIRRMHADSLHQGNKGNEEDCPTPQPARWAFEGWTGRRGCATCSA